MRIGVARVKLYANHIQSLKDKRRIVKSLVERLKARFEVAAAEIEDMDVHQVIVIGFCCVSGEERHARERMEAAMRFVEGNPDAQVIEANLEILKEME